jgi:hypothetical protein
MMPPPLDGWQWRWQWQGGSGSGGGKCRDGSSKGIAPALFDGSPALAMAVVMAALVGSSGSGSHGCGSVCGDNGGSGKWQ